MLIFISNHVSIVTNKTSKTIFNFISLTRYNLFSSIYVIKTAAILFLFCFFYSPLTSQYFGGNENDEGVSFLEHNNKFVLIGNTRSFGEGSSDAIISEIDEDFNTTESHYVGYPHQDFGAGIAKTNDGGYVTLINSWDVKPSGRTDIGVVKYDQNHNKMWLSFFGGAHNDHAYSIKETNDNGIIITGLNRDEGNLGSVFLRKLNENGVLVWEKFYDIAAKDLGKDIIQLPDSSFMVLAETNSFFSKTSNSSEYITNSKSDVVLIKTDKNGNEVWRKIYGLNGYDFASALQYIDESIYIVGSSMDSSTNSFDITLRKLDTAGVLIWKKQYGGLGYEYGNSLAVNDDYDLLITGASNSFSSDSSSQVYYTKLDSAGNILWEKTYGIEDSQEGLIGKFTANNEIVIIGTLSSANKKKQILFIKSDNDGNVIKILDETPNFKPLFNELLVYPNPASNTFHLRFPDAETGKETTVSILDINGKIIYTNTFLSSIGNNTINVNYPAGIYLYKIQWEEKIVTGKLIINP